MIDREGEFERTVGRQRLLLSDAIRELKRNRASDLEQYREELASTFGAVDEIACKAWQESTEPRWTPSADLVEMMIHELEELTKNLSQIS